MRAFLFLAAILGDIGNSSALLAQEKAAAASEAAAPVAKAVEPLPDGAIEYLPRADWRISRTRIGCSLKRDFYNGEDRLTLVMDKTSYNGPYQFGLFATSFGPILPEITTGFWPGGKMAEIEKRAVARLGSRDGFVYADGPAPHRWDFESEPADHNEAMDWTIGKMARTTHYIAETSSFGTIALATGPLTEPSIRVSNCINERLAEWGLDFEALRDAAQRVDTKNFGDWATKISKYYPKTAIHSGFEGKINLRLIVDTNGRVTHCHVADQLVARVLREAACKGYLEFGRFEPTRGKDGAALVDAYYTAVDFKLQRRREVDAHGFIIRD